MIFEDRPEEEVNQVEQVEKEGVEVEDSSDNFVNNCLNCKDFTNLKNSYIHLNADFDNYKRRIAKDQINWVAAGQAQLLLELLDVVDNFDRAFSEHEKKGHSKELDNWLQGFELIRKSLYKFLEKNNVTEITQVTVFDPVLHEAITQIDSPGHESGEIVDVVQRGFKFRDSILRPAKVVVAK